MAAWMKLIWQLGENIGGFCGAGYMVQGSGITHDRRGMRGEWRENTGYNRATVANRQVSIYSDSETRLNTWRILCRNTVDALIKKKIKFSSYIGKFRVEQLQSHT
jgi:hypothetical protein